MPKGLLALYWTAMVAAPLALTAWAIASVPAGVEQIPMQVGFDGEVNRWGQPSELWLVGGILAGCNLLMALCYRFYDALNGMGLVHGVKSSKAGRAILCATALFLVAVAAWAYWFLLSKL